MVCNGCPARPTRKKCVPHDIIEFFEISQERIFEISAPLAKEGLTITEIAEQTGLKRTSIWKALNAKDDAARDIKQVPYERWRKGHKRTGARPPYGFCFLQGEVVRDPKDYPTLVLIHGLCTRGSEIMSILASLNAKNLKSRTGREWSYGVIKAIGKRFDSGVIVPRSGKLVLSEDFLKGIALSPKKHS